MLVLDEPTAMLTLKETEHLFTQIALLKARGVALVYVSHRLEELQRIADKVAVLRDGRLVDVRPMQGVQEHELVERMVGHAVQDNEGRPRRTRGALRLQAHKLQRGTQVRGVSLSLYAGEIMGLAGWSAPAVPSWCACCLVQTAPSRARSACMPLAAAPPHIPWRPIGAARCMPSALALAW